MRVLVDGSDKGLWTFVVLSKTLEDRRNPHGAPSYPTVEMAVLYWDGFVRLKTAVIPGSNDYAYGVSTVLGPFLTVDQDPAKVANPDLHPRISTITFNASSLHDGGPSALAQGTWLSGAASATQKRIMDVTWNLGWTANDVISTTMSAGVHVAVVADITLPRGFLGLGSLSSMWSSTKVHDSDSYAIGSLDATPAGHAADVTYESAPIQIGPADWLSLVTTRSTTHNSGSPDLHLQVSGTN
jgi:hypothetical protein